MESDKQGQSTFPTIETKKKKLGIIGATTAFWVCALAVLCITSACGDGGPGEGSDGQYTGKLFISVFLDFLKDEGAIYCNQESMFFPPLKVMQATKKGNLVHVEGSSRIIWVVTKRRYEDGESLDEGYYIRRGSYEYTTAHGAEKMVPRYVEVTSQNMLEKIEKDKLKLQAEEVAIEAQRKAEEEAREIQRRAEEEARIAKQKAEEEAKKKAREKDAEQGAYELDIPIKSLCGFKLGVPPSQVRPLLRNDDGTPVQDFVEEVLNGGFNSDGDCEVTYRLAKSFRLFTHATVLFQNHGVGLHLAGVRLTADITNVAEESWRKEMKTVAQLMEKKFGVKFEKVEPYSRCDGYEWGSLAECRILIFPSHYPPALNLAFRAYSKCEEMDRSAKKAQAEAGKKTIVLDAAAGADEL